MKAIIFDTETTGTVEPAMCEAAWLEVDAPRTLLAGQQFTSRFNPGKPIEFGAMAVHHITNEDVAGQPDPMEFSLPEEVEYIIGHNIDFDWKVIGEPKVKRICTLAFSRKLWPDDSHTLGAMLYRLEGVSARATIQGAHSALADVQMCRILLTHIIDRIGEPADWDALWKLSEEARIPDVMAFGKHKGTKIKDVPRDYKQWLLRQPDIDQYLAEALKA